MIFACQQNRRYRYISTYPEIHVAIVDDFYYFEIICVIRNFSTNFMINAILYISLSFSLNFIKKIYLILLKETRKIEGRKKMANKI